MSLPQTRILVNGTFMDIHHILEKNRQREEEEERRKQPAMGSPLADERPKMGLLTKTVIRSPVVKWIIPARIRHKDQNDVIFIGGLHQEKHIQIRELLPEGHLQEVATKTDFGSSIRSARVFGTPRKPTVSSGLDAIIKAENPDVDMDSPDDSPKVPPQMLVLALASRDLVFLFASNRLEGGVDFITSRKPLPSGRSFLEQPGKHLAIDPRSRALALAACEGSFSLYALRSMSQLTQGMEQNGGFDTRAFDPLKEEKHFQVDGVILKMEFLHPPVDDEHHVILLLVISNLRTVKKLGTAGQPVSRYEKLPLLFIPLTISSAFMLVCEHTISVYKDILTGTASPKTIPIGSTDAPQYPGSSRRAPLWTHWARPVRREEYSSKHDDLFICREDGIVRFLEISDESEIMVNASMRAGVLSCNIDTAFASLDLGLDREDLLISGGDMSPGGLYMFRARLNPDYMESVSNWAPIIDFASVPLPSNGAVALAKQKSATKTTTSSGSTYACTGRLTQGSISELRHGIEARIGTRGALGEGYQGVNQIWSLPDSSGEGIFVLLSFPLQSLVLHLASEDTEDSGLVEYDDSNTGLDLGSRTLISETIFGNMTIQITERSMRIVRLSTVEEQVKLSRECGPEEKILVAAVEVCIPLVVTALRHDGGVSLRVAMVSFQDDKIAIREIGQPVALPCEPSCLSIANVRGIGMVFVGTTVGTLQIYQLDPHFGCIPLIEHNLSNDPASENFTICEDVVLLSDPKAEDAPVLLCGLRNGQLRVFTIHQSKETDNILLKAKNSFTIGETPVALRPDQANPSGLFALCGAQLSRVDYLAITQIELRRSRQSSSRRPAKARRLVRPVVKFIDPEKKGLNEENEFSLYWTGGAMMTVVRITLSSSPLELFDLLGPQKQGEYSSTVLRKILMGLSHLKENIEFTATAPYTQSLLSGHAPLFIALIRNWSLGVLTSLKKDGLGDEIARAGLHHLVLPQMNVTLASDKACCVAGLWQPSRPRRQLSAPTIFEAELPHSIARLRRGSIRPPWRSLPDQFPGVLDNDILGTSADGSVYEFTLVSEPTWRLLRFIQNMAVRNSKVCPFAHSSRTRRHIEPQSGKPQSFHIDGDILARLLNLGQDELRRMLELEPRSESKYVDFDSSEARCERFAELTGLALGEKFEDPVGAAMDYISYLL
ncbi:MAG: hypothetical protein M1819_004662 [Sarea resinae]|nr:MAG: hypothetical protein M1819_004662 [Sarea resinae]